MQSSSVEQQGTRLLQAAPVRPRATMNAQQESKTMAGGVISCHVWSWAYDRRPSHRYDSGGAGVRKICCAGKTDILGQIIGYTLARGSRSSGSNRSRGRAGGMANLYGYVGK